MLRFLWGLSCWLFACSVLAEPTQFWWQNPQQKVQELESVVQQSEPRPNPRQVLLLAKIYDDIGRHVAAKKLFSSVEQSTLTTDLGHFRFLIVQSRMVTEFEVSLGILRQAVALAQRSGLQYHYFLALSDLISLKMSSPDLLGTLELLQTTYEEAQALNSPLLAVLENSFGNYYLKTQQPELAQQSYLRALELAKEVNHQILLHKIYHNLSILYARQGDMESAQEALINMLLQSQINASPTQQFYSYMAKARFHLSEKTYHQALLDINQAIMMQPKDSGDNIALEMHYIAAQAYAHQAEVNVALKHIEQAYDIIEANPDDEKGRWQKYYQTKSQVFAALGLYKSAYDSLDKFIKLYLSDEHSQLDKVRTELEVRYRVERGEFEAELLRKNNRLQELELESALRQKQRFYFAMFILSIFLLGGAFYLIKVIRGRAHLRQQISLDPLTQLYNRRHYDLALVSLWQHRQQQGFAVLALDIDHFKSINDNYGHGFGDQVLIQVAKQIQACLRQQDIACRIGGEEFMIFITNDNADIVTNCAERLRSTIGRYEYIVSGGAMSVTVSIGVSFAYQHNRPDDLINSADKALYQAKNGGRNQTVLYEEDSE
ncbi:GGDEF domain-containing protein [Motilimonas pumila]|uniref:diguanylate cyclase n=1 Tax=Motilimonas pumila TaxID=2303987 RepID=A0A418YDR9_9GAMM|nr:GGDEF domain-containing protein [Motilimonas pumila]RJG42654.1 GGDEF domain-containing protein [Motilimonas pumila]